MYSCAAVPAQLLQVPKVKNMSQYSLSVHSIEHHLNTTDPCCALFVSTIPNNVLCITVTYNTVEKYVTFDVDVYFEN
jgi:hypothetical protein